MKERVVLTLIVLATVLSVLGMLGVVWYEDHAYSYGTPVRINTGVLKGKHGVIVDGAHYFDWVYTVVVDDRETQVVESDLKPDYQTRERVEEARRREELKAKRLSI
ncbi:hypothetical protein CA13_13760 [Planctomycetes bacterium CA13]|uniref:Uncharacterized protein n=1 Tax=Novipirellula herctigrandis TaxID=2527986 RepID=A0A5C5YY51_9BACT|nr:hypothetical protein CA13_13760 [Planctomycetes bacterium CA13]